MNHSYFSLDHTLDYILIKQTQWSDVLNSSGESSSGSGAYVVALSFIIQASKRYSLKSAEVTLPSHSLTPSCNQVRSQPWLNNIWHMSEHRCLIRAILYSQLRRYFLHLYRHELICWKDIFLMQWLLRSYCLASKTSRLEAHDFIMSGVSWNRMNSTKITDVQQLKEITEHFSSIPSEATYTKA